MHVFMYQYSKLRAYVIDYIALAVS